MTAWLEGNIQTQTIPIHYYRTGGNKPPLVLLHGITDNGLCWSPIAEEFLAEYDVIMLDARAHGLSGRATDGFSLELLASDVAETLRALDVKNIHLLGHSMGGATAALIAARYPELVQTLLLEDPVWHHDKIPANTPVPPPDKNFWLSRLLPLLALPLDERIAQARKENPTWPEAELEPWVLSKEQLELEIFYKYNIGVALFLPYWKELLPHIHCPTLLMTADAKRGSAVSAETAQEAQQLLNNGQIVSFATGHNIRREQHDAFVNTVRTFIRAHE
jgi:N-formylmaleamate deformylase